ncbi:MAG: 4-(cytidine 5'-diphospho)-2-C-methyl-D-erythritol kinase [Bacteroidota bacterium]
MKYIEIKAPAKINIGLFVVSKRADGYHNLRTLFYPISDLYDKLTFEPSNNFEFICNSAELPIDKGNIVVQAKELLERTSGKKLNVKITLEKKIPTQAGLGGGSSDAAATLISLNEMFKLNLKHDQLIELALQLGSDVPFFIRAKPAIGTSRGEILEEIPLEISEPILIVNPGIKISTKEAFGNIKPTGNNFDYKSIISGKELIYNKMNNQVINDFENYAFNKYQQLKQIKEQLKESGALFALMSGSGSTMFGIFKDVRKAKEAVNKFPKDYYRWISIPGC